MSNIPSYNKNNFKMFSEEDDTERRTLFTQWSSFNKKSKYNQILI